MKLQLNLAETPVVNTNRFVLLNHIRRATRQSHEQLENTPPFKGLLDNPNPTQQLKEMLAVLDVCHNHWLPALKTTLPTALKSYVLLLEKVPSGSATGITKGQQSHIVTPIVTPINTPAQAMGYIYVLFGSARGAKTIVKSMEKMPCMANTPEQMRYFYAMKTLAEAHFTQFILNFEQTAISEQLDHQNICDAASQAFTEIQGYCLKTR